MANAPKKDNLFLAATEAEKAQKTKSESEKNGSLSVLERLQMAKVELQKKALKKSGYNAYSKYYYFTLDDFLPSINDIFLKLRLHSKFWIETIPETADANGVLVPSREIAHLLIRDFDNPLLSEEFTSVTAEANGSNNPIQNLGSKHTYMRRYVYMEALDIAETDQVDASDNTGGKQKPAEKKVLMIQPNQLQLISENVEQFGEDIQKALKSYNKEAVVDLTADEATKIIMAINRKKGASNVRSEG